MKRPAKESKSRSSRSQTDPSKSKPTKLRIIGGTMRGRTVIYHGEDFTRPMKDNIRENAFNILLKAAKGAICFDLFAGTGAMTFESLSRGASRAVAVELNRRAVRYIRETADSLDVTDKIVVVSADTFRVAGQLLGPPADDTPWIVFLCPPYILWHERLEDLNAIIRTVQLNAPPGSVLMVETEKTFDQDLLPPGDWDRRTYGGTTLGFIEPAQVCGMNL
ncbi:RsmD family RNA methyltransferase [Rubripirellula reticaptiva]|nr:RsmD family RNA methyltransferase [Rubripirellula reticaptiva]